MSNQQFYEDSDAEEILRLASRDAVSGGMTRERLMQTAAELGISPDAVERAEQQLTKKREADRIQQEEAELRNQFRKERRKSFYNDLGSYIGVNAFLFGIWIFANHAQGHPWPLWVLGGWGIGVFSDFWDTFIAGDEEKKFRRWLKRRNRVMGMGDMMTRAEPILDDYYGQHRGDKMGAIKELRERLNVDLRDAKDLVETYESQERGGQRTIGVTVGTRQTEPRD